MYVTHEEYTRLGYDTVSEDKYPRYAVMADQTVRRYTQNRISVADMNPPTSAKKDVRYTAETNRRGVCELVDLFFLQNNPSSDAAVAKQPVASYSNRNYSENYAMPSYDGGAVATIDQQVADVIATFFTAEQKWRGVST